MDLKKIEHILIDPEAKAEVEARNRFVNEQIEASKSRVASQMGHAKQWETMTPETPEQETRFQQILKEEWRKAVEVYKAEKEYQRELLNNPVVAYEQFKAQNGL